MSKPELQTSNKKKKKNTILLYIRMLLIMGVSLYTSRIILVALGIEDYGIYNLIAGFVTFFVFISNSLVKSMQRYFNVALGKGDYNYYTEIYSMSMNILFLISIFILLIGETVGLWFVKSQLNIPSERMTAVMIVYQASLFTFIVNTLRTPLHASIVAHERMSFYAYISIFEVVLRLSVVFLLIKIPYDHLATYAILYFFLIGTVNFIYLAYCKRNFSECKYIYNPNRQLFKEMLGFSSWSLLGNSAVVVKNQGEAILVNRFFSVAVNAAMGVSSQVVNAIDMFVTNFQTAFSPQLTQTFAKDNAKEHYLLLVRSSKFSFYLLLLLVIPIVFNFDFLLSLWLKEVPMYTKEFCVFILISYLVGAISSPLSISIMASGEIKYYEISHALVFIFGLAVVYVMFKLGAPPYSAAIAAVLIHALMLMVRLYYCHRVVGFSYKDYMASVIYPVVLVACLSTSVCVFLQSTIEIWPIARLFLYLIITGATVYLCGINENERRFFINIVSKKLK